jgi:NAD(P)-dependent dehydrogenase (short-subunit alcohol dehydrogenase family)
MSERFAGQAALVTGGGSGIGRAVALALASEGASVLVAGRREAPLAETVALIEEGGGQASAEPADVSRAADVARIVEATASRYGRLDVACNVAGTRGELARVDELSEETWSEVLGANLTGTWLSLKYEIAHMREHGGGVIVNVSSSIGAHLRRPRMGAYAASKAGASALTRVAALEAIADGVRVNVVSPGATDTPMSLRPGEDEADRAKRIAQTIPIARLGSVEEIAAAVLWLASPESAFLVGHDLVADGGATA